MPVDITPKGFAKEVWERWIRIIHNDISGGDAHAALDPRLRAIIEHPFEEDEIMQQDGKTALIRLIRLLCAKEIMVCVYVREPCRGYLKQCRTSVLLT